MPITCATKGCGTILPDHAKFCPNCGAATIKSKPKPCCYCAEPHAPEVKFCINCGKPPNELPPGIPLAHVEMWRDVFTELKLMDSTFTRRVQPNPNSLVKTLFIGDRKTQGMALQEGGVPVPDTDPKEPWLFSWGRLNDLTPLRLGRIVVTSPTGKSEEFTQAMPRESHVIIATRCRLAFIIGRAKTDAELKLVIPFTDIMNTEVSNRTLSITTRSGFTLSISFDVKIKNNLSLMPKWMTFIAVMGANNPTDARNIVEMDTAARQRRTITPPEVEQVIETFAYAIMYISSV